MPYVIKEVRLALDEPVDDLASALRELAVVHGQNTVMDGALNYTVTRLLLAVYGKGPYSNIQRALGLLEAVKAEYYRRAAAPYEDAKIEQNGDVYL